MAGAGDRGKVALLLVILGAFVDEALQASLRFILTGWPEVAQGLWGRLETGDFTGHRVAGDSCRRLRLQLVDQARQAQVQALVTDLAELAEDLEVAAAAGKDAAGLEQQLVEIAVYGNALLAEGGLYRLVADAFIDAIFLVEMHSLYLVFTAQS
ncbi:hypothetical protein D3C80_925350 [compost metagenome]